MKQPTHFYRTKIEKKIRRKKMSETLPESKTRFWKSRTIRVLIVGLIMIGVVISAGIIMLERNSDAQPKEVKKTQGIVTPSAEAEKAAKITQEEEKAKVEAEAKAEIKEKERQARLHQLAKVRKGEGVEHALKRGLADNPQLFGFKGDTADQKAIKTWAQKKAHQLAILAGYVNTKTGEEVRVRKFDVVAYLLRMGDNNTMIVEEWLIDDQGNFSSSDPEQTILLADSYGNAQFQGGTGIEAYEYVYSVPKAKTKAEARAEPKTKAETRPEAKTEKDKIGAEAKVKTEEVRVKTDTEIQKVKPEAKTEKAETKSKAETKAEAEEKERLAAQAALAGPGL